MTDPTPTSEAFEDRIFLWLVLGVSLAFIWILRPYAGAILWGTVLAIVFAPLNRHLRDRLRQRRGVAAALTLLVIVVLVLFPVALIVESLIQEGTSVYGRIQSGELDVGAWFRHISAALPAWAVDLLDRFGLTNLDTLQARLSSFLASGAQLIASKALSIGQNTFEFVVALFVHAVPALLPAARRRHPLPPDPGGDCRCSRSAQRRLAARFTTVIRATIKGNVVVALVQGGSAG